MSRKTLIQRLEEIRTGHMDGNNSEQYFPADKAIAIIRQWAQAPETVEAMKDAMLAAPMEDEMDGYQSYEDLAKAALAVVAGAS